MNLKSLALKLTVLDFLPNQIVDKMDVKFSDLDFRKRAYSLRSRAWHSQEAYKKFTLAHF
jgi:hypothetical protein